MTDLKALAEVLAKGAHVRIDWQYEELDLLTADEKLVSLTEKEQDILSEAIWDLPALLSP